VPGTPPRLVEALHLCRLQPPLPPPSPQNHIHSHNMKKLSCFDVGGAQVPQHMHRSNTIDTKSAPQPLRLGVLLPKALTTAIAGTFMAGDIIPSIVSMHQCNQCGSNQCSVHRSTCIAQRINGLDVTMQKLWIVGLILSAARVPEHLATLPVRLTCPLLLLLLLSLPPTSSFNGTII